LDASRVSARLDPKAIPLYAGFAEVTGQGIVSTLHRDNAKVACRVAGPTLDWLFDPQTSGGLLASVRPDGGQEVLRGSGEIGCRAAVTGEVTPPADPPPLLRLA